MDFPELNKSGRDREYNLYSSVIRKSIVYAYLFEGLSHRALDQEFIDCPKSPFGDTLVNSMANQAEVSKRTFLEYCHDKKLKIDPHTK
jgi:hypothetical protein